VNFIIIPKFGDIVHDLLDRAVNDTGPYADCTIWRKPNQIHAVHCFVIKNKTITMVCCLEVADVYATKTKTVKLLINCKSYLLGILKNLVLFQSNCQEFLCLFTRKLKLSTFQEMK
jgi:hypothetical protein